MNRRNAISALAALSAVIIGACLAVAQPEIEWRRAKPWRARSVAAHGEKLAVSCSDVTPLQLYRFIDGLDGCLEPMSAADIARLQDPFAVNVLRPGIGNASLWPSSVEQIVSRVAASSAFKDNQKSYMLGEGSQIGTSVAPRDAPRDLRYVVTWGATSTPSIFLSAAPTGTHPGRPAPFLQVIGYDQARNVFNYYDYISNEGTPTRTWTWVGDSTWSRDVRTARRGCFACHINGALNMKELATPWSNWHSPRASIAAANVPAAVASDPLYGALTGADGLQNNFQGLQSRYTQGLVASFIDGSGTISNVPVLLKRLITTTTVNFGASQAKPVNTVAVDISPNFFLNHDALTMPQIGLSYSPGSLTIARGKHDDFVAANGFQLVQQRGSRPPLYAQNGTTYFAFFVPLPAFEDIVAIREMLNRKVITPNFATAVLMVDFQNPVFSAKRASLMRYANQITTAQVVSSTPDPRDIPSQFTALVAAAARSQPPCNVSTLSQCAPEQQFLHYAGQSDWKQRALNQINPYLRAVAGRIATQGGINDYMTLSLSRQAQFASDPGVCFLNELSLFLPRTNIAFTQCKRMNVDGTLADDPQSQCNRSMADCL
jgi:hypothetical protein